jgi:Helix-turn-helix domain
MSIDLMNRLWWREDLPMTEKFVAMAIADAAGDDGVAWPAVKTIAQKCSCSERTVQNAIKSLAGKQIMRTRHRQDRSSFYIFNFDMLPMVERPKLRKERSPNEAAAAEDVDLFTTGAGDSPVIKGRVNLVPMTGESGSMTGESPAPRTIIESSIEPSDSGDFKSPARSTVAFVEERWKQITAVNPGIAKLRKIDDGLAHLIEQRGKAHARAGETPEDVWRVALENVERSTFLRGRAPPGKGRSAPFRLSLGWMAKAANFREILGGRYNDSSDGNGFGPTPDRPHGLGPTDQGLRGTLARFRAARGPGPNIGNQGSHECGIRSVG